MLYLPLENSALASSYPVSMKTGKNKTVLFWDYAMLKYGTDLVRWSEEVVGTS